MGLEWLAAVLQPRDVAPHPNFRTADYDTQEAPLLAAAVEGTAWRYTRSESDHEPAPITGPWQALVESCLDAETSAAGVAQLSGRLMTSPPKDPAQSVALTLIACTAAAELDDYDLCFRLLGIQRKMLRDHDSATVLLRSAIFQQEAIRRCDIGDEYVGLLFESGASLTRLDVTSIERFPTSPGVSWDSLRTVRQIRQALLEAAVSLVPWERTDAVEKMGLPTRFDLVKEVPTEFDYRLSAKRSEIYSKHVAEEFRSEFRSNSRHVWSSDTDLFHALLLAELMGDSRVYPMREEVALLRLARGQAGVVEYADALRLLRQAGAAEELDLVIRRLRFSGPLSPLSTDGRQVLRKGLEASRLRSVELKVLTGAADLMAETEASAGFDVIMAVLSAGGPLNLPMRWQIDALRVEAAWIAAASLARACGRDDEVARFLLTEAAKAEVDDQIVGRALRKALDPIKWSNVSERTRRQWKIFAEGRDADAAGLRDSIYFALDVLPPVVEGSNNLSDSVRLLNSVMLELDGATPERLSEAVPAVRASLLEIREEARGPSWSMSVFDAADVAAGIILQGYGEDLIEELAEFLLDEQVQRHDRDGAFERLSRYPDPLPSALTARFEGVGMGLLQQVGRFGFFSEQELTPWPAALRFLATTELIDLDVVFDSVAQLSSSEDVSARIEAARTIALLAGRSIYSDFLGVALTLSGDRDATVKAHAGRALVKFGRGSKPSARVARRRLFGLLDADGVLAPSLVLRALKEESLPLNAEIRERVLTLARDHPSRSVREDAQTLLVDAEAEGGV